MNKKVSLNDLAKELNLSKTLISMVLNGKGDKIKISKETQKRVLAKAKELNYAPNQFARALRLGKSNTIGLIVPDISNPFYARLALVIENALQRNGYNLFICNTNENEQKEIALIQSLKTRSVEGILLASCLKKVNDLTGLANSDFPLVLVDRTFKNTSFHSIGTDNFKAGQKAAEYFIESGIDRPIVFGLKPIHVSSIQERLNGFLKKMDESNNGIKQKIPFYEVSVEKSEDEIREIFRESLKSKKDKLGVFALNNVVAISILKCMKTLKLKIPEDVSFLSFDDLDTFELHTPGITAIEQKVDEMGILAVEQLLNQLKEHTGSKKITSKKLDVTFKIRASVKTN
jgi:LacI family transcriptional regulator